MQGYTTVAGFAQDEFTEKKSRFIGAVAPAQTEEEAMAFIARRKEELWDSSSTIYAYSLREGNIRRYSDGGEPQGTGGVPVLEVIRKEGLVDVVVVVTRYFGGIKLGAGGLTRAFGHGATIAIAAAQRRLMQPCVRAELDMDYSQYGLVSRMVPRFGARVVDTAFGAGVRMTLMLAQEELAPLEKALTEATAATVAPYVAQELFACLDDYGK